jgi:hypothetical protein
MKKAKCKIARTFWQNLCFQGLNSYKKGRLFRLSVPSLATCYLSFLLSHMADSEGHLLIFIHLSLYAAIRLLLLSCQCTKLCKRINNSFVKSCGNIYILTTLGLKMLIMPSSKGKKCTNFILGFYVIIFSYSSLSTTPKVCVCVCVCGRERERERDLFLPLMF